MPQTQRECKTSASGSVERNDSSCHAAPGDLVDALPPLKFFVHTVAGRAGQRRHRLASGGDGQVAFSNSDHRRALNPCERGTVAVRWFFVYNKTSPTTSKEHAPGRVQFEHPE